MTGISSTNYNSNFALNNAIFAKSVSTILFLQTNDVSDFLVTTNAAKTIANNEQKATTIFIDSYTTFRKLLNYILSVDESCFLTYTIRYNLFEVNGGKYALNATLAYDYLTNRLIKNIGNVNSAFYSTLNHYSHKKNVTGLFEVLSNIPVMSEYGPSIYYLNGESDTRPGNKTLIYTSVFGSMVLIVLGFMAR